MSSLHPGFIYLFFIQQYRWRDPVDADETEFMENVFDALCSALAEPSIKSLFLASEGIDLMVLMMKFVFSSSLPICLDSIFF
jgi:beta-catenin-like protein 1